MCLHMYSAIVKQNKAKQEIDIMIEFSPSLLAIFCFLFSWFCCCWCCRSEKEEINISFNLFKYRIFVRACMYELIEAVCNHTYLCTDVCIFQKTLRSVTPCYASVMFNINHLVKNDLNHIINYFGVRNWKSANCCHISWKPLIYCCSISKLLKIFIIDTLKHKIYRHTRTCMFVCLMLIKFWVP